MIDKTLLISPDGMFLFWEKHMFWGYIFPVLMGFFSVFCIQIYSRIGGMRNIKMHTAFLCAAFSAMGNLWGWAHMVRTPAMIPFYGCGVGMAAAVMSRIYAIVKDQRTRWRVPLPRVIWKGNVVEIQALMERMKLAAEQSLAESRPQGVASSRAA
jgi:hypothetical protein